MRNSKEIINNNIETSFKFNNNKVFNNNNANIGQIQIDNNSNKNL